MSKDNPNHRELVILATLLHGERYGLEIRDAAAGRTGREIPLGSLYVTLDRMESAGFLKSRLGESGGDRGGNRRRYFTITGKGMKAFNEATAAIGLPAGGMVASV